MTEAPWALAAGDLERARKAGLGDGTIVHAVVLGAYFNYLNRVADATGLDYDREVVVAPIERDEGREPVPRPEPNDWPMAPRLGGVSLARRPDTARAFVAWEEYMLERDAPLERAERRILARAAASELCDRATVEKLVDARPRTARDQFLAHFAGKLTATPWQAQEQDLRVLRAQGLDDRRLLDVIAVVAFQNAASRIRLALGG